MVQKRTSPAAARHELHNAIGVPHVEDQDLAA
jgi:hypothetical protein